MGIINPKYHRLRPELNDLCDHMILAQAWKKTHSDIRAHNWYADTLELDASAVNLEKNVENWSKALLDLSYRPAKMKMVPAPKSDPGTFFNQNGNDKWKWGPKRKDNSSSKSKRDRVRS